MLVIVPWESKTVEMAMVVCHDEKLYSKLLMHGCMQVLRKLFLMHLMSYAIWWSSIITWEWITAPLLAWCCFTSMNVALHCPGPHLVFLLVNTLSCFLGPHKHTCRPWICCSYALHGYFTDASFTIKCHFLLVTCSKWLDLSTPITVSLMRWSHWSFTVMIK